MIMDYIQYKVNEIQGRYVTYPQIMAVFEKYSFPFSNTEILGHSVENIPIPLYMLGNGQKKVLMWSQMHGNESTTTKALLDILNRLLLEKSSILENCTLYIIPMLNPDGAKAYTRVNANQVDLNRDAKNLSQPESQCLRKAYDTIQPDFCLNLHDQRTIFSAGNQPFPTTVSFLAPSQDEERTITQVRKKSMEIISIMNKKLQQVIPNQVGRYDDGFNINCTGDMYTSLGTPTILFEAGHYQDDYQREETRKYIALALWEALSYISENEIIGENYKSYFEIPENQKLFVDILLLDDADTKEDIGIWYRETLINGEIEFVPMIANKGNLKGFFGHKTYKKSGFSEFDIDKLEVLGEIKSTF